MGDPYIIDQEGHDTFVTKYVKLGSNIWRVYEESDDFLRLSLDGYVDDGGKEILMSYSDENSIFNPLKKNNVAYYLNRDLYNALPYKDKLLECTFYTGEISFSNGLNYENMYSDSVNNKIGLLNSFDLVVNNSLSDYFLMNTTSNVGSMAYVKKSDNTLEEVKVNEKRKIVPTICISKNIFTGGDGSSNNPYVVE